ncbi:hypothetical protein [Bradyrhizobium sp. LA6.12]|uniref:hypothetical protein n=1 Tax=unclassified Bradyrhizobium TaxID=2631580 RepID=UPI003397F210
MQRAQDWRWASTRAHLRWRDDGLTALAPIRHRFPDFADLLATEPELNLFGALRSAESIGRPLGDDRFLARIERLTGRVLKPGVTVTVHSIDGVRHAMVMAGAFSALSP